MAHNVSNEYKQVIYSGDARNQLKILFNGVELQNADRYCEKLIVKSRIVPNGAKIFSLNNFISKEAEIIFHDIDTSIIQDQVSISIGTLVGNAYEYVPIGIFNIQDQPTNDKNKTTIKLRDNSVKFDFNYNAQTLIEANNGSATKLQILQDICTQAGVTCNITSFIGYIDEIGVYDNTITAREYISRIAEQAGKIATINRSGELIFVDLNNLTTWEIPIDIVEKYENGTTYKIGKVVYEDGIVRYETDDSNDDTLFLDGSNNYINGELVKEQASSTSNSYTLQNTGEADLAYLEIEGKTTQETRSGKNLLDLSQFATQTISGVTFTKNNNGSITLNGTASNAITLDIPIKTITLQSGVSYTLSKSTTYAGANYAISLRQQNSSVVGTTGLDSGSNSLTYNLATTTSAYYFRIYVVSGKTFNNHTIYPMLETGSSATSYEQYGTSPSPDYPSDLVSVGYENLLNVDASFPQTGGGVTVTKDTNGEIHISGTVTGNASLFLTTQQTITLEAGTYTLNRGETIKSVYLIPGYKTGTFTLFETTTFNQVYIAIQNMTGQTINDSFYPILEKSNQLHSYVPYNKYGIEVKTTGKNILPPNISTQTKNGITITNNNDGSYTLDGTATTQTNFVYDTDKWVNLNSGNYYFSSNTFTNITYASYYGSGTLGFWRTSNGAFNLQNDITNFRFQITITNGATFNNQIIKPQLEKGTQATSFEAYKSNTQLYVLDEPLRQVGNYKDRLYIQNGYLYIERNIGKIILNGSESWSLTTTTHSGFTRFGVLAQPIKEQNLALSNYFEVNDTTSTSTTNLLEYRATTNYIFVNTDVANTVETFKTWLSTHNTEVQYVLATPVVEEIGTVELPSTYGNITHINISSHINTNSYIQYRQPTTQLQAILNEVNEFDIDSLKTGKILGNPAIDPYDLIQIADGNKTFKTLATNDLTYTGVLINTFDTQIGEEEKQQNVSILGEATFKKWAKTSIDNIEGSITLQAGQIDEANGRINETNLTIEKDGALLSVLANNSNIDIEYDGDTPISGEVREVTTTTGFKFNAEGMTISDDSSNFYALHRNTGTYYYDGGIDSTKIVGQYTKDGSKQKDLVLFGVYYYGMEEITDTPMFVTELYNDENGEECVGHFYNRGD